MGKSLGNAIFLKDALTKWTPEGIRLFILSTHYRSVLDVTEEALASAEIGLKRLSNTWRLLNESIDRNEPGDAELAPAVAALRQRFMEAMDDDFNTSAAIASLFDFAREANTVLTSGTNVRHEDLKEAAGAMRELAGDVLGILRHEEAGPADDLAQQLMDVLIATRASLRRAKQYQLADEIRNRLMEAGIELEDRPGETVWRRRQTGQ